MKKLLARVLAAAMVVGLLSVSAFAYTAEVSELNTVTPSNSYTEVSTCTHYDGEHPLYIFPAGTTFQVTGYRVVQAWKIESDTGALDFYDSEYSSGSDGATFAPEPGVIYMVQESNQMDWFQYMYIMVEGGSTQPDPEPESTAYSLPDNDLLEASAASTGSTTVTDSQGETHTVYLYPAGTVFTSKSAMTNFERVRNLSTGEYQYGINQQFTLPETGAYELTAFDEGIWTTTAYVMASGGSVQPDPEPEPEPEPEQPTTVAGFSDVSSDAWYAGYVETVVEKGLFSGNEDGTFGPEDNMTYAQFLVVLSQFSGESLPASDGAWYQSYVDWARRAALIPEEMTSFAPDASITRQDMAALFANFLESYGGAVEPVNEGSASFADATSIAGYAAGGVQTCYELGLMSGNEDGTFAPLNTATRAEVAVTMTQMARIMGK